MLFKQKAFAAKSQRICTTIKVSGGTQSMISTIVKVRQLARQINVSDDTMLTAGKYLLAHHEQNMSR